MFRKSQEKATQRTRRRRQDLQTTQTIWSRRRRETLGPSLQERKRRTPPTLLCRHHHHLPQCHHPHQVCPQDLSLWLTEGIRLAKDKEKKKIILWFQIGPRPHKDKKKLPQIETRETQYSPVVANSHLGWLNGIPIFRTLSRCMISTNLNRSRDQRWGWSMWQRRRCRHPWTQQQQRCPFFSEEITIIHGGHQMTHVSRHLAGGVHCTVYTVQRNTQNITYNSYFPDAGSAWAAKNLVPRSSLAKQT